MPFVSPVVGLSARLGWISFTASEHCNSPVEASFSNMFIILEQRVKVSLRGRQRNKQGVECRLRKKMNSWLDRF